MKKNGRLILAAVVVVLLIAVFAVIWFATRPATTEGSKTITVEVVHKDESTKTFTYHTDAEYLGEVLLAEGLVEGDESEYGLMITTVDGETVDDANQEWWCLTKGGEMWNYGADATELSDGDTYELTFTVGY
mgnify:CR=1 FL=1